MPRIFSPADRGEIRKTLIEAGREHFLRTGLRRTNVEELARAAGIAKGTFYRFFDSKEDLCMEIYDEEERRLSGRIRELLEEKADPAEALRSVMVFALETLRRDSLLMRLRETGEYALLARGVGGEKLARHLANDVAVAAGLLESLRAKGATPRVEPAVLAAVLRAVVMISFHEREVGEAQYAAATELIVSSIADRVVGGGR